MRATSLPAALLGHSCRAHGSAQQHSGVTPAHLCVAPFAAARVQVQLVKEGKPYVMFGDGTLAACKPISERDLASFIADCVSEVGSGGAAGRLQGPTAAAAAAAAAGSGSGMRDIRCHTSGAWSTLLRART